MVYFRLYQPRENEEEGEPGDPVLLSRSRSRSVAHGFLDASWGESLAITRRRKQCATHGLLAEASWRDLFSPRGLLREKTFLAARGEEMSSRVGRRNEAITDIPYRAEYVWFGGPCLRPLCWMSCCCDNVDLIDGHISKDRKRDKDKERKHRKRHHSTADDLSSDKDEKEESKKSRRHSGDRKKSRKHAYASDSDAENRHKRHKRDRDGSRRNGGYEELEDGELGEDGEIR
ncbi:hypothetical protein BHM03_00049040 [Ensete ventricosum]|nr:hypothetical protein BHM03_00049040 [Ensete ventricosum]